MHACSATKTFFLERIEDIITSQFLVGFKSQVIKRVLLSGLSVSVELNRTYGRAATSRSVASTVSATRSAPPNTLNGVRPRSEWLS